jgi:2-polyprenyl-3-methyl-5-hydroxy-6-metoxy-1,4-benzoquinol methylase
MLNDGTRDRFLSATVYSHPVDIKKLRFVLGAIERYCDECQRSAEELDVLEIACGVGGITLPLASLGGRVRALDIHLGDVIELERVAERLGFENVTVTVEDALGFDSDERYDVVVASEVFEHLTDPGRLAGVVARHTKPGGVLIVTTPNGYGPWEMANSLRLVPRRWNWLRRLLGKEAHDGEGREHEQRYTKGRLLKLFAREGFEVKSFSNSDFIFTILPPLRRSRFFGTIDTKLGDVVPHWMASGWYMAFRIKEQ